MWAENEPPLVILVAMRTQLRRAGMSGAVYGLDYAVLPLVMSAIGIAFDADGAIFAGLQVAESELVSWCSERSAQ